MTFQTEERQAQQASLQGQTEETLVERQTIILFTRQKTEEEEKEIKHTKSEAIEHTIDRNSNQKQTAMRSKLNKVSKVDTRTNE